MRIILIGPPGVGKGTVSEYIIKELNIPYLSTGAILRDEIDKGSDLGKLAQSYSGTGKLVPTEVIISIVAKKMKELHTGFLLDGFPRNLEQAKEFDLILGENKIDLILHLDVEDEVIIERLSQRLECQNCRTTYNKNTLAPKNNEGYCDKCFENSGSKFTLEQRKDDKPEFVKNRLVTYHLETEPLISFYKNRGIVHTINTDCSIEELFNKVKNIIKVELK